MHHRMRLGPSRSLLVVALLGLLAFTATVSVATSVLSNRLLSAVPADRASAATLITGPEGSLTLVNPAAPVAPELVNFQGILTDSGGLPVSDGSNSVTFRVYDAGAGGNLHWEETQSVTTSIGLFSVLLGSATPLTAAVFDGDPRYLETQVAGDPPMTPRQRFASVPYALHANTADVANDLDCTGCVDPGELASGLEPVPQGAIVIWTGVSCPTSYTRFAALDGASLKAGAAYSAPVAAGLADLPVHAHDAGTYQSASHTHNLWTDVNVIGPTQANGIGPNLTFNAEWKTTHIQPADAGVITGTTGSVGSGNVATVILCQKD